jgi:hypothetical protein
MLAVQKTGFRPDNADRFKNYNLANQDWLFNHSEPDGTTTTLRSQGYGIYLFGGC